jgi:hypothetical protein
MSCKGLKGYALIQCKNKQKNKKVINIDLAKIPKVVVKKRSGETLNLKKEGKKVTKAIGSIFKKKNKKNKKK